MSIVSRVPPVSSERLYFTAATILFAIVVFGAFTPSFFLQSAFHSPAPKPFIKVHGVLMTGWMALLAGQAVLVWSGRTSWHRAIGYAVAGYAAFSCADWLHGHTCGGRARGTRAQPCRGRSVERARPGTHANDLVWRLRCLRIIFRQQTDWHKRLMLLATLCIMPNAIVRLSFFLWPFKLLDSNLAILRVWVLLLLLVAAVDCVRIRRLHAVYLWGMPAAACALYFALRVSQSELWTRFWVSSLS